MQPNFNMNSISLVTDRNNLRKLFNFACSHPDRSFRIDVDMVYNTMFFTRWEQKHVHLLTGYNNPGYGHAFEKAFTVFEEDLANSSGHHRIVQYNLGGMNCIVRFEADAYFNDCPGSIRNSPCNIPPAENLINTQNDISTTLKSLSLQSDRKGTLKHKVKAIQSGRLVSPASVIEVKSRAKKVKMKDVIPQLWFSQTEHLFVGYHREGVIEQEITRYEMAAHFKAWETQHKEQLQRLVGLILKSGRLCWAQRAGNAWLFMTMLTIRGR